MHFYELLSIFTSRSKCMEFPLHSTTRLNGVVSKLYCPLIIPAVTLRNVNGKFNAK